MRRAGKTGLPVMKIVPRADNKQLPLFIREELKRFMRKADMDINIGIFSLKLSYCLRLTNLSFERKNR